MLIKGSTVYLFSAIFLFAVSFYVLWQIFEPIKAIKLNTIDSYLISLPRNPFERLITKKQKIFFRDIKKIDVAEVYNFATKDKRYIIYALLNDLSKENLTQTLSKSKAQKIVDFFNYLIKKI
jgi:hypothetical protein